MKVRMKLWFLIQIAEVDETSSSQPPLAMMLTGRGPAWDQILFERLLCSSYKVREQYHCATTTRPKEYLICFQHCYSDYPNMMRFNKDKSRGMQCDCQLIKFTERLNLKPQKKLWITYITARTNVSTHI